MKQRLRADEPIDVLLRDIERHAPALCAEHRVPGLSLALIQRGALAATYCFGVADMETGRPVGPTTVFQAASLSKPTFALAVLRLVERGALDLDRPLGAYLARPFAPGDPAVERITARMILSHTTGLPNWRAEGEPLRTLLPPGTRFGYSGEGFIYLQRVVEHLTGEPLEARMRRAVLDRLGMRASHYAGPDTDAELVATGHRADGSPRPRRTDFEANAASSLRATPADLARLVAATLAGWRGESSLLRRGSFRAMLRPQVRLPQHPALAWGLGWGLQETAAGVAFWHWGDNPGFKAFAVGFPRRRFGLVLMANGDNGLAVAQILLTTIVGGAYPQFGVLGALTLREEGT